ncbi:response regulator [Mucilaginibacter sp. NFX135]|uniref:response regulator n=1 Tax=Mucilaginibacter sp. NFX135 TaxID=3402687 RepID=UPI003AFA8936
MKTSYDEERPLVHVIEDNYDMRMEIKDEFKSDYRVIDSENGLVGFEKSIASIPDIIISDIQMPGINGIELCKLLKKDERTSHIPIVLITGYDDEKGQLISLKNGADDYVTKPFSFGILRARVNNLVKTRQLLLNKFLNESHQSQIKSGSVSSHDMLLKKAYEIIDQNISNSTFEANDFARAMGMSRAQTYRKIKVVTGLSVKEFIRITRLKKAAGLLLIGDHNISEIAYKVGFSSGAYFSSSFSHYFKISPTRYVILNKSK